MRGSRINSSSSSKHWKRFLFFITMRKSSLLFLLQIMLFSSSYMFLTANSTHVKNRYESIFCFGDSLSDTGNLKLSNPIVGQIIGKLPYGETFGQSSGRFSDGRLIVDFIAEAFGVPLLQPYLGGGDFRRGANFAVAGSTALDAKSLYARTKLPNLYTNSSLSGQLGWFKNIKSSLYNTSNDRDEYFGKSLFIVGEMGINDYTYAYKGGLNKEQIQALIARVIVTTVKTASMLIEEGAVELLVPGNLPVGCTATYLTLFPSPNKGDYDPRNGCLKLYNENAEYHNNLLKTALENLRRKYPKVKIYYADYYGATLRLANSPQRYGFRNGFRTACCGGGGPYNYNPLANCGLPGTKLCKDPSTYANWDGIHLTESAYRLIAKSFLKGFMKLIN